MCSSSPKRSFKSAWTPEEDQALRALVETHGCRKWATIAKALPDRKGKQCRERWVNHLMDSVIKGGWTRQEDEKLLESVLAHGTRWTLISKAIPGRSENAIKNRYYAALRKEERRHRPRETSRSASMSALLVSTEVPGDHLEPRLQRAESLGSPQIPSELSDGGLARKDSMTNACPSDVSLGFYALSLAMSRLDSPAIDPAIFARSPTDSGPPTEEEIAALINSIIRIRTPSTSSSVSVPSAQSLQYHDSICGSSFSSGRSERSDSMFTQSSSSEWSLDVHFPLMDQFQVCSVTDSSDWANAMLDQI